MYIIKLKVLNKNYYNNIDNIRIKEYTLNTRREKRKQMKNKKNYITIIILIILIISVCIIYSILNSNRTINNIKNENNTEKKYTQILENGTKINTSSKLKETKEIDGLVITNIELTENNGVTKLTADVSNKTTQVKKAQTYKISFINSKNEEIATMKTYIKDLEVNETTQINASVIFDYTNAYNFEITKE